MTTPERSAFDTYYKKIREPKGEGGRFAMLMRKLGSLSDPGVLGA